MDIKSRNSYFLIAGVLAILFAVTHAWNGQSAVLLSLLGNGIAMDTQIIARYVWHIITAENLVFGIVFLILSFTRDRTKLLSAAWTIVSLLLVRLMVILGVTAFYDVSALLDTVVDSIATLLYVALILMGIRMKRNMG